MRRYTRTSLYLITLASFVMMCSGLDHALHVALAHGTTCCHESDTDAPADRPNGDHSGADCPVCLQLTIGTTAVVDVPCPSLHHLDAGEFRVELPSAIPVVDTHREPRIPRGPPAWPC
jgi:hypothetical protein